MTWFDAIALGCEIVGLSGLACMVIGLCLPPRDETE